jgi:hypothetical protein
MKPTNSRLPVEAESNGVLTGPGQTQARPAKRRSATRTGAEKGTDSSRAEAKLAPPADLDVQAAGGPTWPLHPFLWLQPAAPIALPFSSGLRIERLHGMPSPDFRELAVLAASGEAKLARGSRPALPDIPQRLPESGLEPLGANAGATRPFHANTDQNGKRGIK